MSMKSIPPRNQILCSKAGVFRGIPICLIFAPKRRLWRHQLELPRRVGS